MVNAEDYKNALEVIKKCKEWAKNEVKEISKNDDFPQDVKLVFLGEQRNYFHRGGRKTYLIADRGGLTTCDYCGDGTSWGHSIHTSEKPYAYAYNNTEQRTIDLAIVLVDNWQNIKNQLTAMVDNHLAERNTNSDKLKNFEL